jgi:hypothetical protein
MADQDAKAIIKTMLDRYKLGDLTDQVWGLISNDTLPANAGIDMIGDALRDTKTYQDRFPANAARLKAGLPELTVSEYVGLERGYADAMRGSGLPAGFYDDPTDFEKFIAGNTSVAEVQSRVNEGFKAVSESNPEVIKQMKELYGVDNAGLAAYFLDPARATPLLVKQARSAQIAAEAARQAGIKLTAGEAEALTAEGITQQQAQQGFSAVQEQKQLMGPNLGEEGTISQQELIGSTFGTDAAAKQRVETRARRRRAAFEQGGGFATGQQGMAGLGEAQ